MRVLSLFDGISCGRVALDRAGIPVKEYFASEIDKYAIQISKKNYPDIIQLGDITELWGFKVDLLIGGSPCQSFSVAGNGSGFDGKSGLFWEWVRMWRESDPTWWLLENVKMKREWQDIISETLGVEPIEINSALVSGQNRKRLYWTNIPGITQPEDKGILLRDILERNPSNPTYMSENTTNRFIGYGVDFVSQNTEKAKCLCAEEYVKNGRQGNYVFEEKTLCISASYRNNPSLVDYFIKRRKQLVPVTNGLDFVFGIEEGRRLHDGKNHSRNFREGSRVYSDSGKSSTLSASSKGGPGGQTGLYLTDDFRVRKLTPIECERLQTLDDNYTEGISNTQRYRSIGNGWTVDVISHILSFIPNYENSKKQTERLLPCIPLQEEEGPEAWLL